jgi:hypothetical protein
MHLPLTPTLSPRVAFVEGERTRGEGARGAGINRERNIRARLIPVESGGRIVAFASGRGAALNVGAVPACDPGVAVWTTGGLVTRTVERQSGSGVRR